ncbi:hypothetical protein D9M71_264940 [compost metagenome]
MPQIGQVIAFVGQVVPADLRLICDADPSLIIARANHDPSHLSGMIGRQSGQRAIGALGLQPDGIDIRLEIGVPDVEDFRRHGKLPTRLELPYPHPLAREVTPYRRDIDLVQIPLPPRQRVSGGLFMAQRYRCPQGC